MLLTKHCIKEDGMGGVCSTYEGKEKCVGVLVGKPESKRPLGRSKLRRKDNIKMYLQEILCESVK